MAKPVVTVQLNKHDFYFLLDSIALNVSDESEMNADERKTVRKMRRAHGRLQEKEGSSDDK